ncbi:MAG: response regulator [Gemmatimonadaceae bacterium]|nr:response regulator [Gemmatimonadaceae bacterium]
MSHFPEQQARRRLWAWWRDSVGITVALLLATLALYEAVSSAPGLPSAVRGWLDAVGVALIVGPLFSFTLYRRHVDGKVREVEARTTGRASGSPHRKVRWAILGALAVMAVITGLMTAVERHATLGIYDIGNALNMAGRQRTYSQQLIRLAPLVRRSRIDSTEFSSVAQHMRSESDSLDRLVARMLSFEDAEARIAEAARRESSAERDALLAASVAFLSGATTAERVDERADAMLVAQEQFVSRLADLASVNIRRMQRAQWTFGLLLLAMLIGVAGLVVEPVVRLLKRQHLAVSARSLEFERLAMVAQRTSTAVVITDARRRIVWVNAAFSRLTGWSPEEAYGKTPGSLLQGPDTDPTTIALLRERLNAGLSVRTTILNRSRDGRPYWLDLSIEPLRERGELTGFLAVESDVTDAIEARDALSREREALTRTTELLEEAQTVARMGNWSVARDSDVVEWSPGTYALFGRPVFAGPPSLRDALERYAPESVPPMLAALETARRSGTPFSLILRTADHNPAVRWIRADGRARIDDTGAIVGVYGILVDVTESVEREAALTDAQRRAEAANRSKSEFLANMSHEIRTPLTAIIGYADWLRDEAAHVPSLEQQHALSTIHRASTHLLSVINDILDLSKIEAGKVVAEQVETVLPSVLLDVESIARARAAAKGVSLETRLLTPIPERVLTDPTRMRQILMNLVGNAIKFTERGRVRVEVGVLVDAGSPRLRITIDDTGVGMTAEQVRELFQPFHQADATVTRRFGGTGLGLSISRRLALLLGGDVSVVWSTPGQGSRFAVELPLHAVDDARLIERLEAIEPARVDTPRPNALAGVRLLLAEDGEDNQRLLRVLLEAAGANVTVVGNGRLALEALDWAAAAAAPYDVLLSDMQMPEMDGYTLAAALRARGSRLPIIALTAHAMADDRRQCLEAGCSDYAVKPIDRAALIATIARWTRRTPRSVPALVASTTAMHRAATDEPDHLISDLADDPDLGPLAEAFAQVLPDRIEAIALQRQQSDSSGGRRLLHQLKGAAGSYGFPTISETAGALELVWESEENAAPLLERLSTLAAQAGRSAGQGVS